MPKELHPVFSVLDNYQRQNEQKHSLSVDDLANLLVPHIAKDKEYYLSLLENLRTLEVSPDTTHSLIKSLIANKQLKDISLAAYDVTQGKESLDKIASMMEQFLKEKDNAVEEEEFAFITDDLEELANGTITQPGLRWRSQTLNQMFGSLRKGDFGFIFARPECLSGDTVVRVKYNKDSTSSRKYTLKSLYKFFNGNHHLKGSGHQIQATTPQGKVYYTDIEHVTYSGKKHVYLVQTERGFSVKSTSDHEFLTPEGVYKQLKELGVGSYVLSDRTTRASRRTRPERSGVWPGSPYEQKFVGKYGPYHRAKTHRLLYDAHLNNLSLEKFLEGLSSGHGPTHVYSDPSMDIHHINGDHLDNRKENLTLLSREEHTRWHSSAKEVGNSHFADADMIISISYVGEEDTYDLGVAGENKNFRANGIFVHNCGKTTFLASETTFMAEQLGPEDGPIIWCNNEEQGNKVKLRCYQASLGLTLPQLLSDLPGNKHAYHQKTKGLHKIFDSATIHRSVVEKVCKQYKPSLVIFDQIDKIQGFVNDREDLRLGAIYIWARELAKEYCPVIAVCQADGTGEGVKWLTMGHVANAKTAKQAEADWILGIGKIPDPGYENVRYLHASKNKLAGDPDTIPDLRHGKKEILINPSIARYEDI